MRIILFIVFTTVCCFSQTKDNPHEFKFYKNGVYKSTKKAELYLIKKLDTIKCEITKSKIIIPKVDSVYSVVIKTKRKSYIIQDVDFSKLDNDSKIVVGSENDMTKFEQVSNDFPTMYFLKETGLAVEIEKMSQANKVNFIIFNSRTKVNEEKYVVKNYSQSTVE